MYVSVRLFWPVKALTENVQGAMEESEVAHGAPPEDDSRTTTQPESTVAGLEGSVCCAVTTAVPRVESTAPDQITSAVCDPFAARRIDVGLTLHPLRNAGPVHAAVSANVAVSLPVFSTIRRVVSV